MVVTNNLLARRFGSVRWIVYSILSLCLLFAGIDLSTYTLPIPLPTYTHIPTGTRRFWVNCT